jgi:hypothetical protein
MLIAGAVCPHPPLLIPDALGSAAGQPPAELRAVADAAAAAVAALAAAEPDLIVVAGGGAVEREYGAEASGGLRAFGVDVTVGAAEPVLPLSLTVGRWLLERAGVLHPSARPAGQAAGARVAASLSDQAARARAVAAPAGQAAGEPPAASPAGQAAGVRADAGPAGQAAGEPAAARDPGRPPVVFQEVARLTAAADCLKLGRVLAGRAPRVALLAMGDSCARPARDAPGVPDPAAREYDAEVAEALAAADAGRLARLDPVLDDELVVAGRAAWQVLAGAAEGARVRGRLLCLSAPYGVTYLVASWEEHRTG